MIRTKQRFKLLDEGAYELTISRRPKLETSKGYDYYTFDFTAVNRDGYSQDFRDFFFPNEDRLRELLVALGGIDDPEGEIQIDENEVVGMSFKAQIKHVSIKGKTRAQIVKLIKENNEQGKAKDEEEPPF